MDVERPEGQVAVDELDESDRQVKLVQPEDQAVLVYGIKGLGEVQGYHGGYSSGGEVGRDNIRCPTQLEGGGMTSPESELILVEEIVMGNMVGDFVED